MDRYEEYRHREPMDESFFSSHFSHTGFSEGSKRNLYRSRNGAIMGVCRGVSEYFDLSLSWVRFIALLLLFFSGIWPMVIVYFIAALLIKPEPVIPLENMDEREFYGSYVNSRDLALERLKRRYESLERKIRRLEHTVTATEYEWEKRLRSGR